LCIYKTFKIRRQLDTERGVHLVSIDVAAVGYVGNEARWRENEDGVKRAILLVDPTQRVTEDGHIVAWDVYTTRGRRSQTVHLQIWRPVRAGHSPNF